MDLNLYDYGIINYDPAIGRWFNMDPLAEKSRHFSPYTHALNNPVKYTDPTGMAPDHEYELLQNIENGNINYISVHSIDRLGRKLFDILSTLEIFNEKKITLKVDNLGIESLVNGKPNSAFKLIISVMVKHSRNGKRNYVRKTKRGY